MIDSGRLVLDAPMDSVREEYRRIEAVFEHSPAPAQFHAPGVERVTVNGRSVEVLAVGNTEEIVMRLRDLRPMSVQVTPVGLRETFLEKANAE